MSDVTRAHIMRAVAARGLTVTPYQWRRWKEAGLIPHAIRHTFGYGHGVQGFYPSEVIEIVARLAYAHMRKHEKTTTDIPPR